MRLNEFKKRADAAPVIDNPEYPTRWAQYIGQEPAVRMCKVAAASARIRKEPLEPILIAHPTPGLGKTALANLIARELRHPCRVISGAVTPQKMRMILATMKDRDVLFYDEVHKVADGGKAKAEWLLHLLQDGTMIGPTGMEQQPRITFIGATTHAHRLPDALLERFMYTPPMQDYDNAEAALIAISLSKRLLGPNVPRLVKAEANQIAIAAGRNPRSMKKILIALRDLTITKELPLRNGRYDIAGMLDYQGITADGLDPNAQRYLSTLAVDFDGQAGAKTLEGRLRQPGGLDGTERLLVDLGLVAMTHSGRTLTQAGLARYQELSA